MAAPMESAAQTGSAPTRTFIHSPVPIRALMTPVPVLFALAITRAN